MLLNDAGPLENSMAVPQELELPYDPATLLLGVCPREMKTYSRTDLYTKCSQQHYS